MVSVLAVRRGTMKNGLTLVELMCAIALLSIIFLISYPSLTCLMRKDSLKISADRLVNDLRYAKVYAMSDRMSSMEIWFEPRNEDGYEGYSLVDTYIGVNRRIKTVNLPKGVIIWEGSTFSNSKIAFGNLGNVSPHACTIVLRDVNTMKDKAITLTIGFSRIMEIEQ